MCVLPIFPHNYPSPQSNLNPDWRCRKNETERCSLYIWDSDLPTAKVWLAEHGPPPHPLLEPQTPKGKAKEAIGSNIKSWQNPWTLAKSSNAKRKAKLIVGEVSDEEENGGLSGNGIVVTPDTESDEMVGDPHSPSRKATKRSRQDTPGKVLSEAVITQNAANSLPTPDTAKPSHSDQEQINLASSPDSRKLREIAEASVRLGEVIDLTTETTSDLTTAVLDELKSAKVHLKESTKAYVAHLIDTEMELHDSRMRRCKVTMAKMKKRLDEMESALVAMTGMTDDDAVELSD
jgi:hypothetical protein